MRRGLIGAIGLLAIGVITAIASAPAGAAVFTATFTGTFDGAGDFAGLFGPPGTDLSGQAFTATYRVDTGTPGIVDFTSQRTRFLYSGEYYYGGLPTAITATLASNGHSVALTGNYKGLIVQENDLTPLGRVGNGDEVFYELDDYTHTNRYFSLSFSIAAAGLNNIVSTEDFSAPGHYVFVPGTYMDNRFAFADGSNLAYGSLHATDLVVRAGVPEPAAWSLMIAGFALTGAALRRRPTLKVVAA